MARRKTSCAPMREHRSSSQALSDLGIDAGHSRPCVSNDNPFSESQFRTLKYRPEFPDRFGSLEHARGVTRDLFAWYNDAHHHSGLSYLTQPPCPTAARRRSSTSVTAPSSPPTRPIPSGSRGGHEAPGTTIVTPDEPQHGVIDGPRSKPADLCSGVLTREETFVHGEPGGIERLPFVGKVCCRSSRLATGRSVAHVWSKRGAMRSPARDMP